MRCRLRAFRSFEKFRVRLLVVLQLQGAGRRVS